VQLFGQQPNVLYGVGPKRSSYIDEEDVTLNGIDEFGMMKSPSYRIENGWTVPVHGLVLLHLKICGWISVEKSGLFRLSPGEAETTQQKTKDNANAKLKVVMFVCFATLFWKLCFVVSASPDDTNSTDFLNFFASFGEVRPQIFRCNNANPCTKSIIPLSRVLYDGLFIIPNSSMPFKVTSSSSIYQLRFGPSPYKTLGCCPNNCIAANVPSWTYNGECKSASPLPWFLLVEASNWVVDQSVTVTGVGPW